MDFEISKLFASEPLSTTDPWGFGYTFRHHAADHPDYTDWLARRPKNPLTVEIQSRVHTQVCRRMLTEARKGAGLRLDDDVFNAIRDEVLEEMADTFEVGADALDAGQDADLAEGVALLLIGWDGIKDDHGKPLEFSHALALELLSNRTLVPAGHAGAGDTVGAQLCSAILETARGAVIVQAAALEAAEKKSEPATDGS